MSDWTTTSTPAVLVLRYLQPLRGQLIEALSSEPLADDCLERLLRHLINQGLGQHGRGRVRDFLLRGIRSAAKSVLNELPKESRPQVDPACLAADAPSWLSHWRQGILERAWRQLEGEEHRHRSRPFYTIYRQAFDHPHETAEMLAVRASTASSTAIAPQRVSELLEPARQRFHRIVREEIARSLEQPDETAIDTELAESGLGELLRTA